MSDFVTEPAEKCAEVPTRAADTIAASELLGPIPTPRPGRPRLLFAMAHGGFYRNFESTIWAIAESGVAVLVLLLKEHKTISLADYRVPSALADSIRFAWSPPRREGWTTLHDSARLNLLRDILHYSRPTMRSARDLQRRFASLQKSKIASPHELARWQRWARLMPAPLRTAVDAALGWKERRLPAPEWAAAPILAFIPDLVVVTPLVGFQALEHYVLKAARQAGIRTALTVASWDNLTNKGRIKLMPDVVTVWNADMAEEARSLHGVPGDRLRITGAPPFDWWFEAHPTVDRATFAAPFGFRPDRPIVLYLCSSISIAGGDEDRVVEEWIGAVRRHPDARLREAGLLVRPHPMATATWRKRAEDEGANILRYRSAAVWPVQAVHPTVEPHKSDFFNAMYHADAIVGLNTSAMIEASILGRPVLTFTAHEAGETQTENLHFRHLRNSNAVMVAGSLDEHLDQLVGVLEDPERHRPASARFVERFVRPSDVSEAASRRLARLLVDLASNGPRHGELGVS